MTALQLANSAPMWIACGIPVILVVAQALLFAKKAIKDSSKMGISDEQVKKAIKSSAITSIGPSVVILTGMLSLLVTVGGPVAWMRLSMIGSVMFESIAAGIGTNTVGVTLGADTLTNEALAMGVWTMVLCSIGWVIFATISATRMDKIQNKLGGGDSKKLIKISTSAVIAVFGAMVGQNLIKAYSFANKAFSLHPNMVACILGALFMYGCMAVSKKNPKLKEWNLTIAMLLAVIVTAIVAL